MELIDRSEDLTAEDFAGIQMDNYDASAAVVVPAVLDLPGDHAAVEEMQEILTQWSRATDPYQIGANSSGAAAYAALWRHPLSNTFEELPDDHTPAGNGRYFEATSHLLSDPSNAWWDDTTTAGNETASNILRRATQAAHENSFPSSARIFPGGGGETCMSPRSRIRLSASRGSGDRGALQPGCARPGGRRVHHRQPHRMACCRGVRGESGPLHPDGRGLGRLRPVTGHPHHGPVRSRLPCELLGSREQVGGRSMRSLGFHPDRFRVKRSCDWKDREMSQSDSPEGPGSGPTANTWSSTGLPPMRCSSMIRSMTSTVTPRYQVPSG